MSYGICKRQTVVVGRHYAIARDSPLISLTAWLAGLIIAVGWR